jgi:two-component system response regulator AlgR
MKILIVDDEAPARMRLAALVQELGDHQLVGEAAGGPEALQLCRELDPDVVLLDIRMPGMDGIETARHLARLQHPPAVVFATAYDQHALEAFEASAVDYLLKPIRKARLEQALAKVRRLTRAQLEGIGNGDDQRAVRTHICVSARGRLQLVPVHEVLYFMADQKYVTVRHRNGEVLIEESLKSLESEFEGRFIRVHRNALVAKSCLEALEKDRSGRHLIRLRGVDDQIEVSRRHVPEVRQQLMSLQ